MRTSDPDLDLHAGAVATALRLVRAYLEHDHPTLAPVFLVASVLRGRCGAVAVDVGFENDWSAETRDHLKSAARVLLSDLGFETRPANWVPALPYVLVFGAPPTNHERLKAIRRRRSRGENGP
ncbi:hypothetical protein MAA5396_04836 [Marinovum algicola]|uniref:Uncharacterized protein n=1 Tax=Marinovum algicola TaxID=42444 RepID=A0A975WF61_9RHOB|nr:hypothetical protein [Marinovum algicola]SEK10305.1 hypothetical protein SAMN04487940_13236 [Marinovum algicola]SLN76879.1 hypothetical protein MAA5396_04836 [Marinovum algicola]